MITISIDPIILGIGHLALRWYSLILLIAIGVGIWLTAREAERKGFKKEAVYDAATWIIVGGIVGARLFHVLDHWSHEYAANPIRALYIWEGGLAILKHRPQLPQKSLSGYVVGACEFLCEFDVLTFSWVVFLFQVSKLRLLTEMPQVLHGIRGGHRFLLSIPRRSADPWRLSYCHS